MNLMPTRIEPYQPDAPVCTNLLLEWNNGESFALPYFEIRFQCPCANCVDEKTGKRVLRRESVRPDVRPTGVQLIGRYAVQITWSDQHATGMYHYDRLHELCLQHGKKLN